MNNIDKILRAAHVVHATKVSYDRAVAEFESLIGREPKTRASRPSSPPPAAKPAKAARGRKPAEAGPSLASRVAGALSSDPQSPSSIAGVLGVDVIAVRGALTALTKAGRAARPDRGRFVAAIANGHTNGHSRGPFAEGAAV